MRPEPPPGTPWNYACGYCGRAFRVVAWSEYDANQWGERHKEACSARRAMFEDAARPSRKRKKR